MKKSIYFLISLLFIGIVFEGCGNSGKKITTTKSNVTPSVTPSTSPSVTPSASPSVTPSASPSVTPTITPASNPDDCKGYLPC